MKNTAVLSALIILLLIVTGCTSTKSPSNETEEAVKSVREETVKIVRISIPVLLSETKYQKSGHIDTKLVNTYAEETDRLLTSVTYDGASEIFETATVSYNGNESFFSYFDREKNLQKKRKTISDKDGNILESVLYDNAGKQISRSVYRYDADLNKKVKWEIYDSSDLLLGHNQYIYENGKNTRTESFSPSGTLEEYYIYTYDADGNMTESVRYDRAGKKIAVTAFAYKNNQIISEKIFRGEKTLLNEIIYEYAEKDGKKTEKRIIKSPNGSVIEIIEKVFFLIEKEIQQTR